MHLSFVTHGVTSLKGLNVLLLMKCSEFSDVASLGYSWSEVASFGLPIECVP